MQGLFLILCVLSTFTFASSEQCQLANWYDKEYKLNVLNKVIDFTNSDFARYFIRKMDPITFGDKSVVAKQHRLLGYDFDFDLKIKQMSIKGFSGIHVAPVQVSAQDSLKLQVNTTNRLDVKVHLALDIKQLTQPGCDADEEHYLGFCYRKCSLFPGTPSDSKRLSPTICTEEGGLGNLVSRNGSVFSCGGYKISSRKNKKGEYECPRPIVRICYLDKLKLSSKACADKKIEIIAKVTLKPSFLLDTMLKVKMCKEHSHWAVRTFHRVKNWFKSWFKKDEPTCKVLGIGFMVKSLISGKWGKLKTNLLNRVVDMKVKKIDLDLDLKPEFDIPTSGKFINKSVDFITSFVTSFFSEKIDKLIDSGAKSAINSFIDSSLRKSFGSTCDVKRLR